MLLTILDVERHFQRRRLACGHQDSLRVLDHVLDSPNIRIGRLAAAIIAAVVIVTTSGGGGGANANTRVHAQDAQATTNAREVATVLDNCPPTSCPPTALAGLGVQIGVGRGEVEVSSGANSITYTIISRSYSGHIFKLLKTVEGQRVYTCAPKGAGGCGSDGTW